ncbi:MAG: PAS domain S-box protein [Ignavibacteria bacterium]|jgi:PAS domain S-box-containing protein|nr:PAS domain S-box protein [Ignavibacteria bacterium]
MSDNPHKRSFTQILSNPYTLTALFFVLFGVLLYFLIKNYQKTEYLELKRVVDMRADEITSRIKYNLYTRIQYNRSTAVYIRSNPDVTQSEWSTYVDAILKYDKDGVITSMSNEENYIIKRIAPFELNKKALNLNLRVGAPERSAGLDSCVKNNDVFVEGPFPSKQDYYCLCCYIPAYRIDPKTGKDTLNGVTDCVLNWDKFQKVCGIDKPDSLIEYAIKGKNARGMEGGMVLGDERLFYKEDIQTYKIELPIGEWWLAAYPRGGYDSSYYVAVFAYSGLAVLSIGFYFIVVYISRRYFLFTTNVVNSMWRADGETLRYTSVSGNTRDLFGLDRSDIVGQPITMLASSAESNELIDEIRREEVEFLYGKQNILSYNLEIQKQKIDGTPIFLIMSLLGITNRKREVKEYIGFTINISDIKRHSNELQSSSSRYHYILNNSTAPIFIIDIQTLNVTFVSNSIESILGYRSDEIMGRPISMVLTEFSHRLVSEILEENLIKLKEFRIDKVNDTIEIAALHKEGYEISCEISTTLLQNEQGDIVEILGTLKSLEEHKKLLADLKGAERIFRMVMDNSHDAIWILDYPSLDFKFMSPGQYYLTGIAAVDKVGMNLKHTLSPSTFEYAKDYIEDILDKFSKGEIDSTFASFEVEVKHKDGYYIWGEVACTFVGDVHTKIGEIVGITRDITERKNLQASIKESEKRYRIILDSTNDILFTMHLSTLRITFATPASFNVIGYTADECVGMSLKDILLPEYIVKMNEMLRVETAKFSKGQISNVNVEFEGEARHKDGRKVWLYISCMAITNEEGEQIELQGLAKLIDKRKLAEQKLAVQSKELTHLSSTKDAFLSIISQDLKNPLQALINTISLLQEYYKSMAIDDIGANIDKIANASNHINQLLDNVSLWALSALGQIPYNPTINDLPELIKKAVLHLSEQANRKQITLSIGANSTSNMVICDLNMISIVLRNLISNAIKYSQFDSPVMIAFEDYDKETLEVSVKDFGVGMKQETINNLFSMEGRSSTSGTANETGSGLGLIVCKEFMDKHKCKIWAESAMTAGTTIRFMLQKAR